MKKFTCFLLLSLMATLTWSQVYVDEDFSNGSLPVGWTNNDLQGSGQAWQFDNLGNRIGNAPISEPFAICDSDHYGSGGIQNAALETPVFDASSASNVILDFDYYFKQASFTNAQMYVEVFDGSNWVEVYTRTDQSENPEHLSMDISADLNGAANAQVRFRFTGSYDYFWLIDNVQVQSVSCAFPSGLTVDNTSLNTAGLSWTANGSENEWIVKYGAPGFDPETEGSSETVNGSPNTTLSGLDEATTYEAYVKAVCNSTDESTFSDPVIFSTTCSPVNDFFENFDNTAVGDVPNCFQTLKVNSTSPLTTLNVISVPNAISSPNVFSFFNSGDSPADFYLISPELTNLNAADHRLRFYFDGSNTGNANLEVGTMTDPSDASTFTSIETVPNNSIFQEYTVDFNQSSTDSYVAFKVSFSSIYYSVYLDDVYWEAIPSCIKPSDFNFDSANTDSADLSWVVGGSETQWEVKYGAPGFDPNSEGTPVTVNGSPNTTLTGLTSNTEYEAYVKAQCGSGDGDSAYTSSITFTTSCGTTTIPFTQDFEAVTPPAIPNCASTENVGSGNDWVTTVPLAPGYTGNALNYTYNSNPADTWYFTQGIELTAAVNYQISYKYGDFNYVEKLKVSYGTSALASEMTTELADYTTDGNSTISNSTVYFNVDTDGVYYFGFNAHSDANQNQLYVDDIEIDLAPTCTPPSDIIIDADNITASSADVTWTENGMATEWEVIYGEAGFDPDNEGTPATVNGTPETTLSGLDSDTEYDVYIRANCDASTESDLTGPETFTTLVSCPAPTNLIAQGTGFESADLSWTEEGDATEWEVIYGTSGFDPENEGSSETVDNGTPALSLSDLDMDTAYEFYVKAICGTDDESQLSGPKRFSTYYCQPQITSSIEPITLVDVAGLNNVTNATVDGTPAIEDFTAMAAEMDQGGSYAIALEGNTNGSTYDNYFTVFIDWNQNGILDDVSERYTIGFITGSTGTDGQQATGTIEVPADALIGTTRMRVIKNFNSAPNDPCENHGYGQIEDYSVEVSESTVCAAPTDIVIDTDNITETSAEVSWTENGSATEWEVIYGVPGFDPNNNEGTSVMDDDNDLGVLLENLDPDTAYDVYVRAICTTNNKSDLAGPEQFTTEMMPCPEPIDITIFNITTTTADVSWTAGGSETEWTIIYGPAGFDPNAEGTEITVTGNPFFTLTGLDPNTDYDVYVIANCDTDNSSDAAGPVLFTTGDLSVNNQVFESFTFYPNPVNNQLTLKAGNQIESVIVYNLLGQNVMSSKPNKLQTQLNTERLQSGVYLMRVTINGSIKTFRVVKK